jgi:hypothetical protein
MDPVTLTLHKTFFDAKQLYMQGKGFDRLDPASGMTVPSEAQVKLEEAMQRWLEARQKFSTMYEDGRYVEEAMLIVKYWQAIHQQNARPIPDDYPLKSLWADNSYKYSEIDREFQLETRGRKLE